MATSVITTTTTPPETKSRATTTTPPTTTTTAATTTTTPLKTTTPVETTEPPTAELTTGYENTTNEHYNLTTGPFGTTKSGDSNNLNTTYLILAIVISVVVCVIIILSICFVTYRRGRRKRIESAEMKQQALKVTPKIQQYADLKDMNGQLKSSESAGTSNKMTTVNVTVEVEQAQPGNHDAISEPQYINLAMVRDSVDSDLGTTASNSQSDARVPPRNQSLTHVSDQSKLQINNNDQSELRESYYANVSQEEDYITPDTNTQQAVEAIYENTTAAVESPEENIYEQAIKDDQIYVHMA